MATFIYTFIDSHIQGAWKVESERGSEVEASLSTNGDDHTTSKNPPTKEAKAPTGNGIKSPKKLGAAAAKKTQQRMKQSQKI